jgi:transposase
MATMAAAIALRSDFSGADLRRLARRTQDARQAGRLLALATIYEGGSRSEAARIGDVGLQIIRDWVLRFNAEGPDGLIDRKAPGPAPRLTEAHRSALTAIIESGPIPAVHGVVRWRLVDLCQWLWEEFRVSVARQTLGRELRTLGYRKLSARPRHHAQAEGAIEHFKKASLRSWQRSRRRRASSLPR